MTQDDLEKEVLEGKVLNARIDQRLTAIEDGVKRLEKMLMGNGKPGIAERVSTLEERQNSVWMTLRTVGSFILSILSIIVAAFAAATGNR